MTLTAFLAMEQPELERPWEGDGNFGEQWEGNPGFREQCSQGIRRQQEGSRSFRRQRSRSGNKSNRLKQKPEAEF